MIKRLDHQRLHLCFEEADLCVRGVSGSSVNSVFEVRSRRASGLAVCSCGNKKGTRESKELVGVAAPSDPVGSILVEILHSCLLYTSPSPRDS